MNAFTSAAVGAGLALAAALALPPAPRPAPPPDGVEYSIPPGEHLPITLDALDQAADAADWGHAAVGVPDAWRVATGRGATVAVLDTGCDLAHPDLRDRVAAERNFTTSRNGAADVQGHGTHVAGIILAAANGSGVVGVAPDARLLVGKVLGDGGSGPGAWVAAGIDWAVANGADVVNLSLGGPQPDAATREAVRRAAAAGVIVVAAAGNEGPRDGSVGYPGAFPDVICVGAVDAQAHTPSFSSRGAAVRVAAPGVAVRSCYPGGRFATMSGTSMSAPYVSGCAALYVSAAKARGRRPDPAEFARLLAESCRDLPPAGRDPATGFGLVQLAGLVGTAPEPAPQPRPVEPPPDRLDVSVPGMTVGGRPVARLVIEFAQVKP